MFKLSGKFGSVEVPTAQAVVEGISSEPLKSVSHASRREQANTFVPAIDRLSVGEELRLIIESEPFAYGSNVGGILKHPFTVERI